MNAPKHPCFDASAHTRWGRLHLPTAPACNIGCAYCDRKTDCVNESRPGVCSRVLSPEEAADLVDRVARGPMPLGVVGIAGPGDPLAEPERTLRTLELVRRGHPDLLLCLSSNGLALADHVAELKALGVGHVTVTVNAVSPDIGRRIYVHVRTPEGILRETAAAEALLERQTAALAALRAHGLTTKVNTVVIPGVNDAHVVEIAKFAAGFGVTLMNCIGLIPVPGTPMRNVPPPTPQRLEAIRRQAGEYVPQMRHCARCRADACGLLAEAGTVPFPQDRPSGRACRSPSGKSRP